MKPVIQMILICFGQNLQLSTEIQPQKKQKTNSCSDPYHLISHEFAFKTCGAMGVNIAKEIPKQIQE